MTQWKWIETFTRQFELCGATGGHEVIVIAETDAPAGLIETSLIALQRTGARCSALTVPTLGVAGTGEASKLPASAMVALERADLVIDFTSFGVPMMQATDVLVVGPKAPDLIDRFAPHAGLQTRVGKGIDLLVGARTLRLSSPSGTEITLDVDDSIAIGSGGCPRPERPRDSWPGGYVRVALPRPADDAKPKKLGKRGRSSKHTGHSAKHGGSSAPAAGTIVLMPGDVNATMREILHSPVTLMIEEGHVCDILGESGDADAVRAYLEAFDDLDAYRVCSITLGLNQSATPSRAFDPTLLQRGFSHLSPGQISVGIGQRSDDATLLASEPLLTMGLRSSTMHLDAIAAVRAGELTGDLTPDIYEMAAATHQIQG